jgi:hypothetical protein
MNLNHLLDSFHRSAFHRLKVNFLLHRVIPFNAPHRLQLHKVSKEEIQVGIPFKRANRNHLKGLHACVMLTAAEYASGLLLLYNLDARKYRLIMKSISAEYHYQGRMEALATFSLNKGTFEEKLQKPLRRDGEVFFPCRIEVKDSESNLLSEVTTNWQIKEWSKVRSK